MRSRVDYLGKDSLGLWQGKMGYIKKNAIILCWFCMQKIAFYFKPIQIIIIKKNKSSKYFKNKKTKMPILPLLYLMGQNGPQVFIHCLILADYT